jgi:hypothetical protein
MDIVLLKPPDNRDQIQALPYKPIYHFCHFRS